MRLPSQTEAAEITVEKAGERIMRIRSVRSRDRLRRGSTHTQGSEPEDIGKPVVAKKTMFKIERHCDTAKKLVYPRSSDNLVRSPMISDEFKTGKHSSPAPAADLGLSDNPDDTTIGSAMRSALNLVSSTSGALIKRLSWQPSALRERRPIPMGASSPVSSSSYTSAPDPVNVTINNTSAPQPVLDSPSESNSFVE